MLKAMASYLLVDLLDLNVLKSIVNHILVYIYIYTLLFAIKTAGWGFMTNPEFRIKLPIGKLIVAK